MNLGLSIYHRCRRHSRTPLLTLQLFPWLCSEPLLLGLRLRLSGMITATGYDAGRGDVSVRSRKDQPFMPIVLPPH